MQGLLQTVPRGGDGGTDGHGVGAGGSDRCYMMLALHLALAGGSLAAAPAPRPPLALALGCQLPRRAAPSASTPPAAPTTDLAARRAAPPGPLQGRLLRRRPAPCELLILLIRSSCGRAPEGLRFHSILLFIHSLDIQTCVILQTFLQFSPYLYNVQIIYILSLQTALSYSFLFQQLVFTCTILLYKSSILI